MKPVKVTSPKPPVTWRQRIVPDSRSLLWLLLIGILIDTSAYFFFRLKPENPAAVKPPKPNAKIEFRFSKVEVRGSKEGTPFWRIWADEMESSRDQKTIYFKKNPHGEFFNMKNWEKKFDDDIDEKEEKKRRLTWKAQYAEYDLQQEKLLMKKKVQVLTDAQDIVKTDHLIWDKATETLESKTRSYVTTSKKNYIEANKILIKTQDKEMYLEGQVFINMKINDKQRIDLDEKE